MNNSNSPNLSSDEIVRNFEKARLSSRRRFPKILHKPGAEFNQVFNFILEDSYMQPHLHQGEEKIEKMYLIQGSFKVVFFNDNGNIENICVLEMGQCENIEIPASTWHTYVMLTEKVVVYETMEGIYNPDTWKKMADWAPEENTPESKPYLEFLKEHTKRNLN